MVNEIATNNSPRLAVKISEAASLLGVSTSTVRRLIERGELKVVRCLRHPLIPLSELARLISVGA